MGLTGYTTSGRSGSGSYGNEGRLVFYRISNLVGYLMPNSVVWFVSEYFVGYSF